MRLIVLAFSIVCFILAVVYSQSPFYSKLMAAGSAFLVASFLIPL